LGISIVPVGDFPIVLGDKMGVVVNADVILSPLGLEPRNVGSSRGGGNLHGLSRGHRVFVIPGLKGFPFDDSLNFGHHEDAKHLLFPSGEVAPIEARDVRDGQSGGLVDGRHLLVVRYLKDKNLGVVSKQVNESVQPKGALRCLRST